MDEITFAVIVGLILQLGGALVIINPKYFWKKRAEFKKMLGKYVQDMNIRDEIPKAELSSKIEELTKRVDEEQKRFLRDQFKDILDPSRVIGGVILLTLGFIIQIIAELYR